MKLHSLIRPLTGSILIVLVAFTPLFPSRAGERRGEKRPPQVSAEKADPRSPEDALKQGLDYLLSQQHSDGGWGQGGGWRQGVQNNGGRVEGANVEDPSDLGNTCVSLVAVLRSGRAAEPGPAREAALKACAFICTAVEGADNESLYVTAVRDTQLQVKIGTYVDTFLAGWALAEVKAFTEDDALGKRRTEALEKVVSKIERNQKADGSYAGNNGWASVLSQGLASKALNNASRSGAKVSNEALDKDNRQNAAGLDVAKGAFTAPAAPGAPAEPSSAGVSLYREAAKWGGLREKTKSNEGRRTLAEQTIADPKAPVAEKSRAEGELKQIDGDQKAANAAADAVSSKLSDSSYIAGFGNNGGEEFLSYMNLTESIHERGGKDWTDWREKMTKTVCGAQNGDGSWSGQHCITGRTFCTSAALLTLLVEKQPENTKISNLDSAARPPVAAK